MTLDHFIESLMHKKYKLIISFYWIILLHALVVHENNNTSNSKSKHKSNGKAHEKPKKEAYTKPLNDSSGSKCEKGKKGKKKSSYCNHNYHPELSCMKNQIDHMAQILHKNNPWDHILEAEKNKSKHKAPKKRGNSHALISINSSPDAWILDSGTSHHMAAKKCFIFYFCMHGSSYRHGR
jgi:hypothetical protein